MKFIFLTILLNSQILYADTISFRADNWCPFNCQPTLTNPGYSIDIINATLGRAGHVIDYQIRTWERSISETKEGKFNAVLGAAKDELPGGLLTVPMGNVKHCFFVKADSLFKYNGISSLQGKKIGIIKDYLYEKEINEDIKQRPKAYEVGMGNDPLLQQIRKLDKNRIDIQIENEIVFNYNADQEKVKDHFKSAGCLPGSPLFIAFNNLNPKNKEYIKIINEGIEALRKSGELKNILSKYNVTDWK
jgi:polar amino acid transport system substrate-binding protein